jgi:ribonuclease Z
MFNICLLGCGGTMPMYNRYLTSLLLSYKGRLLLIDCGEGTQVSMKLLGWGFKNIDIICLTHYHADHVVGLPGLLLTIANSGRSEELTIIGPCGLKEVINGLSVLFSSLPYSLKLIEIDLAENERLRISNFMINSISVDHGVPCVSYSIEILRNKKFDRMKAEYNKVPVMFWNKLQKGEQIFYKGRRLTSDLVLGEERKGLKVCYATDTRPINEMINFIKDSELFICEGMYGDDESLPKAIKNKHMLFSEAAVLAKEGGVKELWLTHFSPALCNPDEFLENAANIFKNIKVGKDRLEKQLFFSE